ncbi:MAG: protein phosphatase 2C domain-containing protein [Elusimicrobia bacterium]|nr:protein phosphatase 2C domain-containing protein [Elusimicrobiota bacterium]
MRHLLAAGSCAGRDHVLLERPNQDAYCALEGDWGAVAVVCDGCGSQPHSGVGARLGACMAAALAARRLEAGGSLDLERLRADILSRLALIAQAGCLGVQEHLLFTIVGAAFAGQAAVSTGRATVFACGDGVWAVDGVVRRLGPFPDNCPPYMAYGLEDTRVGFERLYEGPAGSVLVGTDGAAEADLPPFWSDERYLRNPDLVRRTLRRNRLADDATVALIIRKDAAEGGLTP